MIPQGSLQGGGQASFHLACFLPLVADLLWETRCMWPVLPHPWQIISFRRQFSRLCPTLPQQKQVPVKFDLFLPVSFLAWEVSLGAHSRNLGHNLAEQSLWHSLPHSLSHFNGCSEGHLHLSQQLVVIAFWVLQRILVHRMQHVWYRCLIVRLCMHPRCGLPPNI